MARIFVSRFETSSPYGERPVRLHRSMRAEAAADEYDGKLEGICIVIDELIAAGFDEAAEAMMGRLFYAPRSGPGQPGGAPVPTAPSGGR